MVEKITRKITAWATRAISYAGRVALINSVLMGLFNFWATIFILPNGVTKEVERLCRNYLRGANARYKRILCVSWDSTCQRKKNSGLGIKNLEARSKACITNLVWAVATKKDSLWVK